MITVLKSLLLKNAAKDNKKIFLGYSDTTVNHLMNLKSVFPKINIKIQVLSFYKAVRHLTGKF